MENTTFFTNAIAAKPIRKLGCYILDFFIALILLLGIFGIEEAICNNVSSFQNIQGDLREVYNSMIDVACDSKLLVIDDSGNYLDEDIIVKNYICGSTKKSLENDSSFDPTLYSAYTAMDKENDNCYYYFVTYKSLNIDSYKEEYQTNYGKDYYLSLFKQFVNNDDIFEDGDYPYLTIETSKKLDEYFRNSNFYEGKNIYSKLFSAYKSVLDIGIKDLENGYKPYIENLDKYNDISKSIYLIKTLELFIGYLLSIAICYLLLPIILKDGRTISLRVFKLGVTNFKHERLSWYNYLLKYLATLLFSTPLMAITGIIFYGIDSGFNLIIIPLFLNFTLLSMALYTLIIWTISYALVAFLNNTHQSLSELISLEIVKDSREFKAVEVKELR